MANSKGFNRGFLLKKKAKKTAENESSSFKSGFLLGKEQKHKTKTAKGERRAKKDSSQTNGFARGFLLSTEKTTRKKHNQSRMKNEDDPASAKETKKTNSVSQDLKDIDGPSTSRVPRNSLLVLEQSQNSPKQRTRSTLKSPLISVVAEETVSEEISSRTPPLRPLIEEINPANEIRNPQNRSSIKKQSADKVQEPLLHEVTSRRQEHGTSLESRSTGNWGGICITKPTSPPANNLSHEREPSWLKFQQELETNLWKSEKQKANEEKACDTKNWTIEQVTLTWQRLLQTSSPERHRNVLQSLLLHHPRSVASLLKPQNQDERVVALNLVSLLKGFLTEPKQEGSRLEWKIEVLNALSMLCQQKRRTVLAQESWTTAILALTSISYDIASQYPKTDGYCERFDIRVIMGTFEDLMLTKLSWLQAKTTSNKQQIEIAVLQDWRKVNRLYLENVDISWCDQLCHQLGGLRQSFCNSRVSWVLLKEVVISFLDSTSAPVDGPYELERRSLLRGIYVSVATTAKMNSSEYQDMANLLLKLLPKCKCSDTIDLMTSLLSNLWSDSAALPPDLMCPSTLASEGFSVPPSFDALMDILQSFPTNEGSSTALEPACRAAGHLVARCIIGHSQGMKLVQAIVKRHGVTNSTLHVLATIVMLSSGVAGDACSSPVAANSDENVLLFAANLLLVNIPSSAYLRNLLPNADGQLFASSRVPLEFILPKLIQILVKSHDNTHKKDMAEARSSVSSLLTAMMRVQISNGDISRFIRILENALQTAAADDSTENAKNAIGRVCSLFGAQWRRALLDKNQVGEESFGGLLVAIAETMFSSPSSLPALCLFGAVVGDDVTEEFTSDTTRHNRIVVAVEKLASICCRELKMHRRAECPDAIFGRLSPLLILRRIPVIYFRIARGDRHFNGKLRTSGELISLSNEMAIRLHMHEKSEFLESGGINHFSTEERRLAAEIAGRCLSFGAPNEQPHLDKSKSCSLFQRICAPAFGTFITDISDSGKEADLSMHITRAKGALYAVWNHISFSTNEVYYDEDHYLSTAIFALNVVGIDLDMVDPEKVGELVQLQTGCIEFFSVCVDKVMAIDRVTGDISTNQLVKEMDGKDRTETGETMATGYSASTTFPKICTALVSVVKTGSCGDLWFGDMRNEYSVSARICLWNVFIVVTKRCDDDSLIKLARSILPWITDWVTVEPDDNIHHPLCVSAALQVIFIFVTRSKTLLCFSHDSDESKKDVQRAHRWSLAILKSHSTGPSGDFKGMRLAALKLVLAIVTVDHLHSNGTVLPSFLGPGELGETFNVINGLCNMDTDLDVRSLSSHILGRLGSGVAKKR